MGDLRPLGSEKLQGIDKLKRIMEIARYNEPTTFINEEQSTLEYNKTLSDGYTYGIVKEKNGYIIKRSLNESPMEYIDNMKGRKYYRSYSEALKRLNLTTKELNRLNGYDENISLIGEQEDVKKKFVLKTKKPAVPAADETTPPVPPTADVPAPPTADVPPADVEPPMGMEPAAPPTEPGMEPPSSPVEPGMEPPSSPVEPGMEDPMAEPGMEDPMAEPGMESDVEEPEMDDEESMGPVGLKTIQKLTGRLSQKIRSFDKDKGMDSQDIKYVVNSILSAIDLTKLDDEDRDDILDKLEQYEAYGEEGEGELDMSDEEMDMEEPMVEPGMEEPMAEPGVEVPPVAESRVEKILMSYFDVKKSEKPILEDKVKKEYLKIKLNQIKLKNEIVNLSESRKQIDASLSLINENYKFVGKTNKENMIFTKNGRQVKVTPRGRII